MKSKIKNTFIVIALSCQFSFAHILELEKAELFDTVNNSIYNTISIIENHKNKNFSNEHLKMHLENEVINNFNFESLAKNIWNNDWKHLSVEQQALVVDTLKNKIYYYFNKVLDNTNVPEIKILKHEPFSEKFGKVYCKIIFNELNEYNISLKLKKANNDHWEIVDFDFKGFLFSNYIYNNIKPYLANKNYDIAINKMFKAHTDEETEVVLFKTVLQKVFVK